jgi:cytochrome b561
MTGPACVTPRTAIALHWLIALLLAGGFALGPVHDRPAQRRAQAQALQLAQVGRRDASWR